MVVKNNLLQRRLQIDMIIFFKKLIFLLILIACIFYGFVLYRYFHPLPESGSYQEQRDEILAIVNAEEFDVENFKELLQEQADFKVSGWPKRYWYSVTFNDPQGGITIYHDTMMALAFGIKRLYEAEDPLFETDRIVNNILNKRSYLWHDLPGSNHYAREFAGLAALANIIGDTRYEIYKEKLHKSVAKLFDKNGSPLEGVSYGLYTVKMLVPYVYLTNDQEMKQVISNFHKWLESVAAADGDLPLFEDSAALQLPLTPSYFKAANETFFAWLGFSSFTGITNNANETVFRRANYTLWHRHRINNVGLNLHKHFSALDIQLKTNKHWWLVGSGYPGWDQKFDKPYLQNIVTRKKMLTNNWWWRISSLFFRQKPKVSNQKGVYKTSLGIVNREIISSDNNIEIKDSCAKEIKVIWNIKGEMIEKSKIDNVYKFVLQQDDETMTMIISGTEALKEYKGKHALQKNKIFEHTVLEISGKDITTNFQF